MAFLPVTLSFFLSFSLSAVLFILTFQEHPQSEHVAIVYFHFQENNKSAPDLKNKNRPQKGILLLKTPNTWH